MVFDGFLVTKSCEIEANGKGWTENESSLDQETFRTTSGPEIEKQGRRGGVATPVNIQPATATAASTMSPRSNTPNTSNLFNTCV